MVVVDPHTGQLFVEKEVLGLTHRWVDGQWTFGLEGPLTLAEGEVVATGLDPLEEGGWERVGPHRRIVYDTAGLPIRVEGDEGALNYHWDDIGLSRIEDDLGTTWHLRYDAGDHLAVIQRTGGDLVDFEYRNDVLIAWAGPDRVRTRYLYDDEGRLRGMLWVDGSRVHIQRDDEGRVTHIRGPGTWQQSYRWTESGVVVRDPLGLPTTISVKDESVAVTDPVGRSARMLYNDGQLAGWTDPRGMETRLERTASGRISAVDSPWGTWRLGWNSEGIASITDPGGARWGVERDTAGRVVAMRAPDGRSLRWDRDSKGRIDAVGRGGATPVTLERDLDGRVVTITSPRGAVTRLRRNANGEVASIMDAAGNETFLPKWTKGRPAQILTRRGALWSVVYDLLGRVRSVDGPRGRQVELSRNLAGLSTAIGEATLSRRTDGAITRVVDSTDAVWGVVYDIAGRPRAARRPDGSQLEFTWSLLGEKVSVGDIKVQRNLAGKPLSDGTFAWDWDLAGRLSGVTLPTGRVQLPRDSTGKVREVRMGPGRGWAVTWDSSGRTSAFVRGGARVLLTRNPDGLITGLGDLSLQRDERGVVFRKTHDNRTWRALIDPEGLASRWTGPDGQSVSVDRDVTGTLSLVRFPDGTMVRRDWSPGWTGLTMERPDGEVVLDRRIELDDQGRMRGLQERGVLGDLDRTVHRDPSGEIVALEEALGAWTWTGGQLESPDGALVRFDDDGVPIEATPPLGPMAWNVGAEVLTYIPGEDGCIDTIAGEGGSWRLHHDTLGRLVELESSDGRWRIEWDLFGRPSRISGPDGVVDLLFDHRDLLGWVTDEERVELVGSPEWGWSLYSKLGESVLTVDDEGAPRLHLVAAEVETALRWTPTGFPREELGLPLGPQGTWLLMPGGPLLDGGGAWDPVSGARTCSSMRAQPWPELDGTASPSWDPEPWMPTTVWTDPLRLLLILDELDPLLDEPMLEVWEEAPPLGWMPSAAATPAPPLAPEWGSLPVDLDPVTALLLRRSLAPVRPPSDDELLDAILGPELEGQPRDLLPELW